jgi:hypothetical protein
MNPISYTSSDDSDRKEELRKPKVYKERINYDNLQPAAFKEKFRVRPTEAELILTEIGRRIQHKTSKNHALSPAQQLLTALHWMGNGSQYHAAADMHNLHKSTVCRTLKRVVNAIVDVMFQKYVAWPEDMDEVAAQFFKLGGFPSVCGAVDGSLIPIDTPTKNEAAYVDRHGNHSINAMMIGGPDCTFYYVSARWPGSVHDSRVLRNSYVSERFDSGWRPFPNAVLLGMQFYIIIIYYYNNY